MKYILPFALLMPMPVAAYDVHTEYRIYGDEIASVVAPEIEVEDPASLIITTVQGEELLIESDGFLDDCQANLGYAMGDATAAVQIVVHQTAQTMNGVMVVQCSLTYR